MNQMGGYWVLQLPWSWYLPICINEDRVSKKKDRKTDRLHEILTEAEKKRLSHPCNSVIICNVCHSLHHSYLWLGEGAQARGRAPYREHEKRHERLRLPHAIWQHRHQWRGRRPSFSLRALSTCSDDSFMKWYVAFFFNMEWPNSNVYIDLDEPHFNRGHAHVELWLLAPNKCKIYIYRNKIFMSCMWKCCVCVYTYMN